jgi:adenylate cyclase
VVSEVFANACRHDWRELGEFPIAGFSKAQRVYGLAEETPVVMA